MMMPANYSVIAENEMTYVVGGGVIEAIGAVTAPIWTAANVKTFNTTLLPWWATLLLTTSSTAPLAMSSLRALLGRAWARA